MPDEGAALSYFLSIKARFEKDSLRGVKSQVEAAIKEMSASLPPVLIKLAIDPGSVQNIRNQIGGLGGAGGGSSYTSITQTTPGTGGGSVRPGEAFSAAVETLARGMGAGRGGRGAPEERKWYGLGAAGERYESERERRYQNWNASQQGREASAEAAQTRRQYAQVAREYGHEAERDYLKRLDDAGKRLNRFGEVVEKTGERTQRSLGEMFGTGTALRRVVATGTTSMLGGGETAQLIGGAVGILAGSVLLRMGWMIGDMILHLPQFAASEVAGHREARDIAYWSQNAKGAESAYNSIATERAIYQFGLRGQVKDIPLVVGKIFQKTMPGNTPLGLQEQIYTSYMNSMAVLAASGQGYKRGWEFLQGDMKGMPEAAMSFAELFNKSDAGRYMAAKKEWSGRADVQRQLAHMFGIDTRVPRWEERVQQAIGKYDEMPGAIKGEDIAKAVGDIARREGASGRATGQFGEWHPSWSAETLGMLVPDWARTDAQLKTDATTYISGELEYRRAHRERILSPGEEVVYKTSRKALELTDPQMRELDKIVSGLDNPANLPIDFGPWKNHGISGTDKQYQWTSFSGLAEQMQMMWSGAPVDAMQQSAGSLASIDQKMSALVAAAGATQIGRGTIINDGDIVPGTRVMNA